MLLRCLVAVGWMGLASTFVNVATAEDAVAPVNAAPANYASSGVRYVDTDAAIYGPVFDFNIAESSGARFARLDTEHESTAAYRPRHGLEVSLIARGDDAGLPVDVAFAQRASMSVSAQGDIERRGSGSELRIGRHLTNVHRRASADWDHPAWYFFAASDDEALTWQPNSRSAFGGAASRLSLQDRVEIGDHQAGITYERGGLQASLAYVQREISVSSGSQSWSQDESFTGFTLTMRHP